MNTYNLGDMTQYGVIVERQFEGVVELRPEWVEHYPNTDKVKLNQFGYNKPGLSAFEVETWCTTNCLWDGPRKMRDSMFPQGTLPYDEAMLFERNYEPDRTFGTVGPLVLVLNNGKSFAMVNPHSMRRFSGPDGIVESRRQRHGSTDSWVTPKDGDTMIVKEYKSTQMGLLLTNSACIAAKTPDGTPCLARIRAELTVASGIDHMPELPAPFIWVTLPEYMFLSMDIHGQGIVGRAIVGGYLKKPYIREVRKVLKKLPIWVAEQTK